MYHRGKEVVVHSQTSNLAFVAYVDDLQNTFNVKSADLTDSVESPRKRKPAGYDDESFYKLWDRPRAYVALELESRHPHFKGAFQIKEKHISASEQQELRKWAIDFLNHNPEFEKAFILIASLRGRTAIEFLWQWWRWESEEELAVFFELAGIRKDAVNRHQQQQESKL